MPPTGGFPRPRHPCPRSSEFFAGLGDIRNTIKKLECESKAVAEFLHDAERARGGIRRHGADVSSRPRGNHGQAVFPRWMNRRSEYEVEGFARQGRRPGLRPGSGCRRRGESSVTQQTKCPCRSVAGGRLHPGKDFEGHREQRIARRNERSLADLMGSTRLPRRMSSSWCTGGRRGSE